MSTPMPRYGPVPDAGMRLSDSERDTATAELGEHYAEGRLTKEEFEERTERIFSAKTRGEIPGLFADLPSRFAAPPPAPAPAWANRGPAYAGVRPPRMGPAPRGGRVWDRMPGFLKVLLVIAGVLLVLANLPWVLAGLLIWLVASRAGGCHGRSRSYSTGSYQTRRSW